MTDSILQRIVVASARGTAPRMGICHVPPITVRMGGIHTGGLRSETWQLLGDWLGLLLLLSTREY